MTIQSMARGLIQSKSLPSPNKEILYVILPRVSKFQRFDVKFRSDET
jgi:hypothetical protein